MAIDPIQSKNLAQTDAARLGGAGASGTTRAADAVRGVGAAASEPREAAARDSIDLSAASRSLVEQAGAAGAADRAEGLSPERLATVLDRLKTGFYDTAEVRDQVARRVMNDLGSE